LYFVLSIVFLFQKKKVSNFQTFSQTPEIVTSFPPSFIIKLFHERLGEVEILKYPTPGVSVTAIHNVEVHHLTVAVVLTSQIIDLYFGSISILVCVELSLNTTLPYLSFNSVFT
jgi:hypothetical protein